MKNNFEEESALLSSYQDNGLIVDVDKSEALSFLSSFGGNINQYILRYGVLSSRGDFVFVPGTTFSTIKSDILFDRELQNHVISSVGLLEVEVERRIWAWSERVRRNYSPAGTLEQIWFDYNTIYPLSLKESISSSFGLDPVTFSEELEIISYAFERAKEGRKLVDHVFLDSPSFSFPMVKKDMIASVIYMNEGLLNYVLEPLENSSFNTLLKLIDFYSIDGSRLGLTY